MSGWLDASPAEHGDHGDGGRRDGEAGGPAAMAAVSPAASLRVEQTVKDSPSIAPQPRQSRTPAMLMIAGCSSQVRQWETTILASDHAIQRTQYMPGVDHHMWNGLDDNNDRTAAVITAFLQDKQARRSELDALTAELAKQLQEVQAEREELVIAERDLNRLAE